MAFFVHGMTRWCREWLWRQTNKCIRQPQRGPVSTSVGCVKSRNLSMHFNILWQHQCLWFWMLL